MHGGNIFTVSKSGAVSPRRNIGSLNNPVTVRYCICHESGLEEISLAYSLGE